MRLPLHADEELAGPVPEGMFTLRHVSHSVCRDTGMENRTLATTLSGCATRWRILSVPLHGQRKDVMWDDSLKKSVFYLF